MVLPLATLAAAGGSIGAGTAAGIGAGTTSALIGAGGSIASSLLNNVFSGGSKKGPSMKDQIGIQGDLTWDQLQTRHRFGEKYGIHPLVMMGINPSSGGLVPQNYDTGGIKGQNLGRAMAAGIQGYQQKQLSQLAVERARLENELLKTQITNINRSPGTAQVQAATNIPGQGQVQITPPEQFTKKPGDSGTIAGKHASFKDYDQGKGLKVNAPYSEEGMTEALGETPVWYRYPKWVEIVFKRTAASMGRSKAYEWLENYNKNMANKRKKKYGYSTRR